MIGIGTIMLIYGFQRWHTLVQPVQDEVAELTLEKLRYEVEVINENRRKNKDI